MTYKRGVRVDAPIPFRWKLLAFGGALAVVPMSVFGWQATRITRDGVKTLTRELQISVAADVARTVGEELRAAQDGLDLVGRTLLDPQLAEGRAVEEALRLVAATEAIDHVGVFDREGQIIDTIHEQTVSTSLIPRRLSQAVRAEADASGVATGDIHRASDGVRVLLVVPLQVDGTVTGYAATMASLARVQERVELLDALRFRNDENALWIVDSAGSLLAHPDVARVAASSRASRVPVLETIRRGSQRHVTEASAEYTNSAGDAIVATVVGIPSRGWWVVAQQPVAIAYATLFSIERLFIFTAAASAVLAVAAAFFLSRRITRPIELLADFATDLAHRRFDRRITVATRDELAMLGDVMSAAARDLEESEHRIVREVEIRQDLGRYLPGELVEKVVRREHDMELGGRRREITVLFADVVAFTPLTERLSAEEVVALLNELFTMLTEIVFRHGGTIDKFIGDCVMAVWGAAGPHPDHARHALEAAEDMLTFLETSNVGWRSKLGITVQLAIGVNSGEAVVGNIGSETRMEFTAIGDVVNVAARLESIARPQQILVGAATRALGGDGFRTVDRGTRELSGHSEPIHVFELLP